MRTAAHPRELAFQRRIRRDFLASFLHDRRVLASYEREVRRSGLLDHVWEKTREYDDKVRRGTEGRGFTPGAIGYAERIYLYAILRTLKPRLAVETGVANGFSTAFSLLALARNGEGELYSIDLPREVGKEYAPGTFYEGEGRAGIPPGSMPGWLVPENLREHWTLVLGRSQDELPPLLARLGTIDFFMHDSEHSLECMWFEYTHAWPALRGGGVLVSDDVNANDAFPRFARESRREPIKIARGMAFLVK
jgi:predicted O-methyltransferase YrrM